MRKKNYSKRYTERERIFFASRSVYACLLLIYNLIGGGRRRKKNSPKFIVDWAVGHEKLLIYIETGKEKKEISS